ncbi:MAG: DedA family protein [Euryarchaeota archaeon]|nr:DedA family protein [Euryarchaeota archaeon]
MIVAPAMLALALLQVMGAWEPESAAVALLLLLSQRMLVLRGREEVLSPAVAAVAALLLAPMSLAPAALAGMLSYPLLRLLSSSGLMLLYPLSRRRFALRLYTEPASLRVEELMRYAEQRLAVFIEVGSIFLLLYLLRANALASYFLYMAISNTILPLPTPPAVLAAGAAFGAVTAALAGGIANCIGATVDYYIGRLLPGGEVERKLKPVLEKFRRHAFAIIVFAGFTPFVFDPFRLAAGYVRYSLLKYWLAVFIGRTSRYFILAWLGMDLWEFLRVRL